MAERKTFLDTLQKTVRDLEKDGIITQEQLNEKIDIPIEWLYSRGIDRVAMAKAMDNICRIINPAYKNTVKSTYAINHIRICDKNGKIVIEVPGRDDWTCFYLSDGNYHKKSKISYFSSEEFAEEIYKTMLETKLNKIKQNTDSLSTDEIMHLLNIIYDQSQKENGLKGISISLSEMIENFGQYYRYLYDEKKQTRGKLSSKVVNGGLAEQGIEPQFSSVNSSKSNEKTERKNEIYPFEERDMIFRRLMPLKIISFDSIGEDGEVIKGTYTSYVYKNQRENGGYFLISEPYQGDKSNRAVYLTEEFIQSMKEEDEDNIWADMARFYLEMSTQDFDNTSGTCKFNHGSLENYEARMQYIVSEKITPNVPKSIIYSAKLNLARLFGTNIGKKKLGKIAESVTNQEINEARSIITPKTVEQDVGGRE